MVEQKVELRKIRDFGENFTDTFGFLKQNLKSILPPFLSIAGVLVLVQAILMSFLAMRLQGFVDEVNEFGTADYSTVLSLFFSAEYILLFVVVLIAWVSMKLTLCAYLRAYIDNGGEEPTFGQVFGHYIRNFIPVFFASFVALILMVIGLPFCAIPSLYFFVVLMPIPMIIVIEGKSLGQAFSRGFELSHSAFWMSLAVYLVAAIIWFAASMTINVIASLLTESGSIFSVRPKATQITTATVIASSITDLLSRLFYIIFFISTALQYFTMVEQKDGTGILDRINTIGDSSAHRNNIEEQY